MLMNTRLNQLPGFKRNWGIVFLLLLLTIACSGGGAAPATVPPTARPTTAPPQNKQIHATGLEFEEPAVYKAIPVAEAPFTGVLVERIDLSLYVQAGATDLSTDHFCSQVEGRQHHPTTGEWSSNVGVQARAVPQNIGDNDVESRGEFRSPRVYRLNALT